MVGDLREQPRQQHRKDRLQHQVLYKVVVLSFLMISILIVIYFKIWSTYDIHLFGASPISVVSTKPMHNFNTTTAVGLGHEEADVYDATLIVSSSSCVWDPFSTNSSCTIFLSQHLSTSLNRSRALFLSQLESYQHQRFPPTIHRRWLLLGDSTVFRLFLQLRPHLMMDTVKQFTEYRSTQQRCLHQTVDTTTKNFRSDFHCTHIHAGRCNTMEQFHLPRLPTIQKWQLPDFAIGEGPMKFGYDHPYCTDCDGCDSHILSCTISNNDDVIDNKVMEQCQRNHNNNSDSVAASYIGPSYGGYLSVEFARDVELQTVTYRTTQENFLSMYIANEWNKPIAIHEFGRPICVVSTGHHDVAVPNITLHVYLQNVQWYLELLIQQCDYILWISNNCPATDNYHQTIRGTNEWNIGVRDLLLRSKANRSIRSKIFYMDIFNASQTWAHDDNIHMSQTWYKLLSSFLQNIMRNLKS